MRRVGPGSPLLLIDVLLLLLLLSGSPYAEATESAPACKVDAFLSCGWMYIPPKYDGKTLFPSGIYELAAFPDAGVCTQECLDIIHGPHCTEEKGMLMEACNALQCSVDVKAACGVSDLGKVTWWKACRPQCEEAMLSPICEGTEEIYAEFKRYKESFGPFGSECSTWKCMKELDDKCPSYDSELQYMPAQAMCDVECYAAMTSDVCRLAHISVMMADGSISEFSQRQQGYGPQAEICNLPMQEVPSDLIDLLPLKNKPSPSPPAANQQPCANPPCWVVDSLPDDLLDEEADGTSGEPDTAIEDAKEIGNPAPEEAENEEELSMEATIQKQPEKHAVQFVASLAFEDAPEGFLSSGDPVRRLLLQTTSADLSQDEPTVFEVENIPESFATEYKRIIAKFASSLPGPTSESMRWEPLDPAKHVVIRKIEQSYHSKDNGQSMVVLDIDTEVIFRDPDQAAWFMDNMKSLLAALFASLGKVIGSALGSRELDIDALFLNLGEEPVITDSRGQPSQPIVVNEARENEKIVQVQSTDAGGSLEKPAEFGIWVYILVAIACACGATVVVFVAVWALARRKKNRDCASDSSDGSDADQTLPKSTSAATPVLAPVDNSTSDPTEPEIQLDLPEEEAVTAVDGAPMYPEGDVSDQHLEIPIMPEVQQLEMPQDEDTLTASAHSTCKVTIEDGDKPADATIGSHSLTMRPSDID